jgi:aminoglycoside phosphotransferase family enzyme
MIVLRRASTPPLENLCEISFCTSRHSERLNRSLQYTDFQIIDWNKSQTALLFLILHESENEQMVVKILQSYQDKRYSLETLNKRHQCLLKALRLNRIFSPELYIGLAPLYDLDLLRKNLCIGEIIANPTEKALDANVEYVLLMKPQDREFRIDYLLAQREFTYLMPLVEYVASMHVNLKSISLEEGVYWGRYEHLISKLEHNLELLDFLVDYCEQSDWDDRQQFIARIIKVKRIFQAVAMQDCYPRYFTRRVEKGYIKHCHGDVKSPHIWVASGRRNDEQVQAFNMVDAVDFNDMYSHIDILSDFALLLADVQARTHSLALVNEMTSYYLSKTQQNEEETRAVLDYYCIEKAIVCAGISILYNGEPHLGRAFLEVAENRLASICSVGLVE